jgi:ribosome-associated protein
MAEDVAGDLVVTRHLVIPGRELRWQFTRSAGPGGQSVNTTDSRVALSWRLSESTAVTEAQRDRLRQRLGDRLSGGVLVVTASEERSQWQNRRVARERLAALVRAALAPPPAVRRPTRPSRGAQERRLAAKKRRGELKRQRRTDLD